MPEAGIAFHPISVGKLRRYWDWQNVPDLAWRAPAGVVQSFGLLRRLEPDLVFATGGFVALPVALAARAAGVPLVVHEQTSVPGLANRIAGRLARRIAITFPMTGAALPAARVTLTGNPLRPELAGGSREEACRLFGLDPRLPIVYVTGGAQGSHTINRTVGGILDELLAHAQVIHQSGDNPADRRPAVARRARPRAAGGAPLAPRPGPVRRRGAPPRLRGGGPGHRAQRGGHRERVLPSGPAGDLHPAARDQRRRADRQCPAGRGGGRRRRAPSGDADRGGDFSERSRGSSPTARRSPPWGSAPGPSPSRTPPSASRGSSSRSPAPSAALRRKGQRV